MDTIKVNHGAVRMVAHRGVSGLERENTNAAFVAAGNRSYWGVETDIWRTVDGEFVAIHDGNTKRVAGDTMAVEEATFETVRRIRLKDIDGTRGRTDLVIPSLEEYIAICKKYEKYCVLELKSAFTDEEIARMIERITALGWLDHVVFISFRYENLQKVKAIVPDQTCQFLTGACDDELIAKLKADRMDLDISHPGVTEELVVKLHAAGVEINVWTVDKTEIADRLISWGVDYITSNILE